jgi:hypothetical protein
VNIPVIHEWLQLWNTVGLENPPAFAATIAIIETLSTLLALFFAAAGATWSVDSWMRGALSRFRWLTSPEV